MIWQLNPKKRDLFTKLAEHLTLADEVERAIAAVVPERKAGRNRPNEAGVGVSRIRSGSVIAYW